MRGVPKILPNGNLLVRATMRGPDGTVGHAMKEIAPGSAEFERWTAWMKRQGIEPEPAKAPSRASTVTAS